MTSATVSVWKDCGYTEGAYIVPSQSDTLPSPDFTFTLPSIPRDTLFSAFSVRHPYSDLYDCSYLRISYDFNNGSDITLYGWIDNVGCMSDTADSPNTTISWHVDLWRTYLDKASFGAGTVTRRLPDNDDPPQSYPFKTSLVQDIKTDICPSQYPLMYWAFINLTTGASSKTTTTYCWPVNINAPNLRYQIRDGAGNDIGLAPSYNSTVEGLFDEIFGIDPAAIYGAWLSPISPAGITVTQATTYTVVQMDVWKVVKLGSGGCFKPFTSDTLSRQNYYPERSVTINEMATDTVTPVVTDFDGQPVLALPWGVRVMYVKYRIINADVSMYISFRFVTKDSDYIDAPANGLSCTIPLKTLPLSENAKSSYIYSGQQEYDRTQMDITRNQTLLSTLTSGGQSTATNAIMSSIGQQTTNTRNTVKTTEQQRMFDGKYVPRPGGIRTTTTTTTTSASAPAIGIGAAAGITAGITVVGAVVDWAAAGYFNDTVMDNTLGYMAQKTAAMTLPSSGTDWVENGRRPTIVRLTWDQYSIDQRENDLLMYGARVHETHDSCQSIIDAGGPLQINNLNVTGAIPVQAKNYFRRRFSDGVKIV